MPYTPTTWSTGDIITATLANHWETQYQQALDDMSTNGNAKYLDNESLTQIRGGNNIPNADCDSAVTAGVYNYNTGTANIPPNTSYGILIVRVSAGDTWNQKDNWIYQFAMPTASVDLYMRSAINGGSFSSWLKLANINQVVRTDSGAPSTQTIPSTVVFGGNPQFPAAGAGQGVEAIASGTTIWSITRNGNDTQFDTFGSLIVNKGLINGTNPNRILASGAFTNLAAGATQTFTMSVPASTSGGNPHVAIGVSAFGNSGQQDDSGAILGDVGFDPSIIQPTGTIFQITSVSWSSGTLSVTVKNTGSSTYTTGAIYFKGMAM